MTGQEEHAGGQEPDEAGQKPDDGGNGDEERRAVDEDAPTPEGLTSPGQGADDAPSEPRQAKDYT
jgi:hypothetical protein